MRDQGSIRGQTGAPGGPGVKSTPGQGEEHESGEQQNVAEFQKMVREGGECVVPYCPEKAPLSPSPYLIISLLLLILPI